MKITWIIPNRCQWGPMEDGQECGIIAELTATTDAGALIGTFCQRHGKPHVIEAWLAAKSTDVEAL